MVLIGYRHGLRASEIADLEWSQVEFGRHDAARASSEEQQAGRASDSRRRICAQVVAKDMLIGLQSKGTSLIR
jgi:integrase